MTWMAFLPLEGAGLDVERVPDGVRVTVPQVTDHTMAAFGLS